MRQKLGKIPLIICVTGKMAAGKNTVCTILEKNGFVSLDTDWLVHSAIKKAEDTIFAAFSEESARAGINLKNEDGSLNRRSLGKLVFQDKKLLERQESIVHPLITQDVLSFIEQNKEKNIILNATVLYKTKDLISLCTCILFVTAPLAIRFFRAKKRDGLQSRHILARFNAQKNLLNEYKKCGIPIIKIKNTGSKKRLEKHILKSVVYGNL
ncbi:MAG: dephospho-CoA kinase [Treponema sp.]|nr:dephospho-CoA kinase [Treponema sp.]